MSRDDHYVLKTAVKAVQAFAKGERAKGGYKEVLGTAEDFVLRVGKIVAELG